MKHSALKNPYFPTAPFRGEEMPFLTLSGIDLSAMKRALPAPFIENHTDSSSPVYMYWQCWELLSLAVKQNMDQSLPYPFPIDANHTLSFKDAQLSLLIWRYSTNLTDMLTLSLDHFYSVQEPSGFIPRQISIEPSSLKAQWLPFDPSSLGPNLLAWTEWNYYTTSGDKKRLEKVYPHIKAYHYWQKTTATYENGLYYTTPIVRGEELGEQMSLQEDLYFPKRRIYISAIIEIIVQSYYMELIAKELGVSTEPYIRESTSERDFLISYIQENLWDEERKSWLDAIDGQKVPASWWSHLMLLTPLLREEEKLALLASTEKMLHDKVYAPEAPHENESFLTGLEEFMLIKCLDANRYKNNSLKFASSILQPFAYLLSNYDAYWSTASLSNLKTPQALQALLLFVPLFLEDIVGLHARAQEKKLIWNISLLEEHGVRHYPLGPLLLTLVCRRRQNLLEEPRIVCSAEEKKKHEPIEVTIRWAGGERIITV